MAIALAPSFPLIIAHRGASGYRPEHTLAGYELAARLGADYLEPDLVSTADGVLVSRHEPEIGATTDVAAHPEFADRETVRTIDGRTCRGWFVEDFTAAELRTLNAVERLPGTRQRNTLYDGRYPVPTLDEVLALADRLEAELGRPIGVYPETKNPDYFASLGLALEPALVDALDRTGRNHPDAGVFVQSFADNLRALHGPLRVPLVRLLRAPVTVDELAEIAGYAAAIGPAKELIFPLGPDGRSGEPTRLVRDAHTAGLAVHVYTFRNENRFLPAELRSPAGPDEYGNALAELERFFALGVDAVFTDNPDTAALARAEYLGAV